MQQSWSVETGTTVPSTALPLCSPTNCSRSLPDKNPENVI